MRRLRILLCLLTMTVPANAGDLWSLDFTAANNQYLRDSVTGFDAADRSVNIAAWVKFKSLNTMAFCGTDVYDNDLWWNYDNSTHTLHFHRGPTGGSSGVNSATWTPNLDEWYFLAVTYNTGTVRFYVGSTELSNHSLSGGCRISAAGSFDVGAVYASWDMTDSTWMPFDGQIAGLVIVTGDSTNISYVWSAADVAAIYNSASVDTPAWASLSKIKRLYTMEEGAGTTTSNGYSGGTATLSGVTGVPAWVSLATAPATIVAPYYFED